MGPRRTPATASAVACPCRPAPVRLDSTTALFVVCCCCCCYCCCLERRMSWPRWPALARRLCRCSSAALSVPLLSNSSSESESSPACLRPPRARCCCYCCCYRRCCCCSPARAVPLHSTSRRRAWASACVCRFNPLMSKKPSVVVVHVHTVVVDGFSPSGRHARSMPSPLKLRNTAARQRQLQYSVDGNANSRWTSAHAGGGGGGWGARRWCLMRQRSTRVPDAWACTISYQYMCTWYWT